MSGADKPAVARPERLSVRFERAGNRLAISHWRWRWQNGLVFTVALVFWTVPLVVFLKVVVNDPRLNYILLVAAASICWILLCVSAVMCFLQHDTFTLDTDGANLTRRVLFPVVRQHVPLVEILDFDTAIPHLSGSERGTSGRGIEMHTLGQPRAFGYASIEQTSPGCIAADPQFAFGLPDEERTWLMLELNEHLSVLQRDCPAVLSDPLRDRVVERDGFANPVRVLAPTGSRLLPLSSFRWQRVDDSDGIVFLRAGRLDASRLTGTLLFASIVNIAVWCIILTLFSADVVLPLGIISFADGMLVCTPVAIGGALLIVGVVLELIAPFRRTVWRLATNTIESRRTCFGIGRTTCHAVERIDRLELRQPEAFNPRNPWHILGCILEMYATKFTSQKLALVGRDGADICVLDLLTEAEARWIADIVFEERRAWLAG